MIDFFKVNFIIRRIIVMKKLTRFLFLLAAGLSFTFGVVSCADDDTTSSNNNNSQSGNNNSSSSSSRTLSGTLSDTSGTATITGTSYVFKDSDGDDCYKGSVKSVADAYIYLTIESDWTFNDAGNQAWVARGADEISYEYLKISSSSSSKSARDASASSSETFTAYQLEKEDFDNGTVYKVYTAPTGGDLFVAPATNTFKVMSYGVKAMSGECKQSNGSLLLKYENQGQTNYTAYTLDETSGSASINTSVTVDATSYTNATAETIEAPSSSGSTGGNSGTGESGNSGSSDSGNSGSSGTYTVVYNGETLMTLTQEQYAAYALILTEGTDYTISGTTITLTAAGMAKLSENDDDEHGTGEYEESDENEVYSVYYGTEKIFGLTEEDFAEFSQMLELNTDYTISGTNITLTDNGLAKIMAMDPSDEEDEDDYYYQ